MVGKKIFNLLKKRTIFEILSLLLVPFFIFLSSRALFKEGFFRTVDDLTTVRIDYLFRELKRFNTQNFPVRMSGELAHGASYPLYLYYPSLSYYAGAILMFFGKSHIVATKFIYAFPLILGPIIFYFVLRKKVSHLEAITGTAFYTFFVYRGFNIYFRGDAPEAWANTFIPLVFLGLFLLKEDKRIGMIFLSFGLVLVILSHHLTGAISLAFSLLYGVIYLRKNKKFWISMLFSLLITAFYSLPVSFYLKTVKLTYLKQNQNQILETLYPTDKILSLKLPQNGDMISGVYFYLLFFLILSLLIKYKSKLFGKEIFFWAIGSLLIYFLISQYSYFFWFITLPVTRIFQFSWRLLNLISLIFPFFIGLYLREIKNMVLKKILIVFLLSLNILFINYFRPISYSFYYNYQPEGPCGTVSHENEFLPIWVKECFRPKTSLEVNGNQKIKIIKETPLAIEAEFNNEKSTKLIVNKYYFPGWTILDNGKKKNIEYNFSKFGIFRTELNPGDHHLIIFFKKTMVMWLADLISLFSFLYFLRIYRLSIKSAKKIS